MTKLTTTESKILEELEFSDLSSDALKKRVRECVVRTLGHMQERKLVKEYKNEKTGDLLWKKL